VPLSESAEGADTYTKPLVADIERLTAILGDVIRTENPKVYDLYERFRAHALARANQNDGAALERMVACGVKISAEDAYGVIRAFTQTLNLINAAEVAHRLSPATLRPVPYALYPTPCTLRPVPYALYPTPCTLYPTPYTQTPSIPEHPQSLNTRHPPSLNTPNTLNP
jgi:hypothetical protein